MRKVRVQTNILKIEPPVHIKKGDNVSQKKEKIYQKELKRMLQTYRK